MKKPFKVKTILIFGLVFVVIYFFFLYDPPANYQDEGALKSFLRAIRRVL